MNFAIENMEKIGKNESMFFRFLPLKTASFAFLPLAILLTLFVFITFIAFMLLGLADFIDFITVFIVESLRPMVEGSLTSRSPPKQIHNQIRKPLKN